MKRPTSRYRSTAFPLLESNLDNLMYQLLVRTYGRLVRKVAWTSTKQRSIEDRNWHISARVVFGTLKACTLRAKANFFSVIHSELIIQAGTSVLNDGEFEIEVDLHNSYYSRRPLPVLVMMHAAHFCSQVCILNDSCDVGHGKAVVTRTPEMAR